MLRRRHLAACAWLGALALVTGCAHPPAAAGLGAGPALEGAQLEALLPDRARPKHAWARAIGAALDAHGLPVTRENACAVAAVIEQESGYQPDPVVQGLPRIVRAELSAKAHALGPLAGPLLDELFAERLKEGGPTFGERLARARTEGDVDRLFRALLHRYEEKYPRTYATLNLAGSLLTGRSFLARNPITTAGSMQVRVDFAEALARERHLDPSAARDLLYTLEGGVYFGAARLLGYPADYPAPLYRFADYNAGVYASRNAALQAQLSRLTGMELVPDGDLLAYDAQGAPASSDSRSLRAALVFRLRYRPDLSEGQVRRDLRKEKEARFAQTRTYQAVKEAYRAEVGEPDDARLPQVTLRSPKLSGTRSTAWFARAVDARYQRCLAAAR